MSPDSHLAQRIAQTVGHLSEGIGPRPPGSRAEAAAAAHVQQAFEAAGLRTSVEEFASDSHTAVASQVRVDGFPAEFASLPSQFSRAGAGAGPLLFLGSTDAPRGVPREASGRVGLLVRGSGRHPQVIRYLLELEGAGLEALVVVSPYMDGILTKAVRYPELERMPVVAVSYRTGVALRQQEGRMARVSVTSGEEPLGTSRNVVGLLPGRTDRWLVVSAHLDTAPFAPGALDNASGVAVLLEVVRQHAGRELPGSVLFVATGSEEHGQLDGVGAGAKAFYAGARTAALEECVAHLEIDDVGNWIGAPRAFLDGSGPFHGVVARALGSSPWKPVGPAAVGCDHGAAVQCGVPYVWLNDSEGLPRPFYHAPQDALEFLDAQAAATAVPAACALVTELATHAPFYPYVRRGPALIRPARYADIPAVLEVTREAFGPMCMDRLREDYFGEELGGRPWHEYKNPSVEAFFRQHPYQCIVAEEEGAVVGYATYVLDAARGLAEIGNNAVRPARQGRGLGQALQREVARRMDEEGYQRRAVATLAHDAAAQAIYEKLGYRRVAESYWYLR